MLELSIPAWNIALRTILIYLALLLGLRLSGKREVGQMTLFDLIVLLLLANAVQNAMVGPDTSLLGGIIAAAVLLVVNNLVSRLRLRWTAFRHLVEGSPTVLVLHGQLIGDHLKREGLDEDMLMAALREHGIADIQSVEMAVLEIDGSISVVPSSSTTTRMRKPMKILKHNG